MEADAEGPNNTRGRVGRPGVRVTKWVAESKADRRSCTCTAAGCRGNIEQRSVRVRSAANTRNSQWYHPGCVEGGLGPFAEVAGASSLEPGDQDSLRAHCDQPGRPSRAEYVADIRGVKRARQEGANPQARGPAGSLLQADAGEGPDLPEDVDEGLARSAELRNMAWWDSVSYQSLEQWVPTLGRVPRDTLHELALLRGAVCSELRDAFALGDLQAQTRAEKLLTYLDRLVLHSPRSTRGGKGRLSKIITGRVRLAWAGDWGALWREAAGASAAQPLRGGRQETLKEQARRVETFIRDSLMGKAVARVFRDAPLAVGGVVYDALAALFPPGVLPAAPLGVGPTSPERRERMVAEASRLLGRWPSRAAPGCNGSRFEHWGAVTLDSESLEAAAHVVVMFALGEGSVEFLRANLGARVLALRKPDGKLRPVACGSVLRRLAARVVCAVFREDIQQACGKHQFAVGRKARCEFDHKAVSALS